MEARHKADSKRVLTLLDKAVISASLKDKDDLIKQIRKLWEPHNQGFENVQKLNATKGSELVSIREQLKKSMETRDLLRTNTSFASCVDDVRRRHPKQTLISDIQAIEGEIETHFEVPFPNKLQEARRIEDEDKQLFALLDLYLHRREELAYAIRKRLLLVEQSQDSTEEVHRDFGNVPHLVEKFSQHEAENQRLRDEEKVFINNAISKRRNFGALSPFCARELAVAFGEMFGKERNVSARLEGAEHDESSFDIEQLLGDNGFTTRPMEYDQNEYANTTEPDTITALVESNDPNTKVNAYGRMIHSTEAQIEKLIGEVQAAKGTTVYPPEGARSRIGRLIESNDQLLDQVSQLNTEIDEKQELVKEKAKEFATAIKERESAFLGMLYRLDHLKQLSKSHVILEDHASLNKDIVSTLYHIVCAMGKDLAERSTESDLCSHIQSRFLSVIAELRAEDEAKALAARQPTPPKKEDTGPRHLTVAEMQQQLQQRKKRRPVSRRRTGSNAKTGPLEVDTDTAKQTQVVPDHDFLLSSERPRFEVLHGLAVASEAAGYLVGVDNRFGKYLSALMKPCREILHRTSGDILSSFENDFRSTLNELNILQNSILVKAKEDISVQTDPFTREDIVIQTDAEQPAKPKPKK